MVRNLYLVVSTEQIKLDASKPASYSHHALATSNGMVGEDAIMHMYHYIIGREVMTFKADDKDYFKNSGRLYHCVWAFSEAEAFEQVEDMLK